MPTPQEMAQRGADILSRYRHPDNWLEGDNTGLDYLKKAMVLVVEPLRLGGKSGTMALDAAVNASSIRAWAQSVGIRPYQLRLDVKENATPRIYVPSVHWQRVLPHLQALSR